MAHEGTGPYRLIETAPEAFWATLKTEAAT
jgi:hypothetical protein